jgi:hypothetical protein
VGGFNEIINAPAGDRITVYIDDNRSFYIINSADAATAGVCDRSGAEIRFKFVS